ncbi:MAG: hypothetical protein AB7U20_09635 [Planctomycetaceae bacterium]
MRFLPKKVGAIVPLTLAGVLLSQLKTAIDSNELDCVYAAICGAVTGALIGSVIDLFQ